MSLSTQLARGTLALPLLLLFALLGVDAARGSPAEPAPVASAKLLPQFCSGQTTRQVLVLAQAPGDLGQLAVRWSSPCRA